MNILSLSRGEVVAFVQSAPSSYDLLREYDICKALAEGKTQIDIADKFGIDERQVRRIKSRSCPECGRTRG